jgi:excisionase family DNA binding protein
MHESDTDKTQWFTLGEAAERLSVHRTTLRRWADEGQIPFMLTPGGHRRFAASDLDHLAERRHSVKRIGPVERMWANQALERTRLQIMAHQSEGWFAQHDGDARNRGRDLGRQLMALTLRGLTAEKMGEEFTAEARRIGLHYGQHARDLGLPLTEALQASMFFRDALVTAAIELPENVRIPLNSQQRLLNRINKLLNMVQLGVASGFDDSEQQG